MELGKWAMAVPSPELAQALLSHLCFDHNRPSLWKFLQQSLHSGLLFPLHVLSILSARVIPNRRSQPKAYRLYLELLSRYALTFEPLPTDVSKEKIIKSVDDALKLSQTFGLSTLELGHVFVLFLFSVIGGLIDSLLDDYGLQSASLDKSSLAFGSTDMVVDSINGQNFRKQEPYDNMRCKNCLIAMEVLGKLTESKKTTLLLRLVHLNMPEKFNGLLHRLQLLGTHISASPELKSKAQLLAEISTRVQGVTNYRHNLGKRHLNGMLIDNASCKFKYHSFESPNSASWVPLDIYLENAMDGRQLPIRAIDVLTDVTIALHVLNQATWQETFLALWHSALRLVQRFEDRDPVEGPIPHLEARLSVLLCIVPLVIANILEDEMILHSSSVPMNSRFSYETYGQEMYGDAHCPRKHGLILSLQVLGQFSGLLCPPALVSDEANVAATKAAQFVHNSRIGNDGLASEIHSHGFVKAGGNLRHLIVEACIVRNLINTSAYFWPDYVSAPTFLSPEPAPAQKSPWLAFMEGAPMSDSLICSLASTPAPSLAEIEKLYNIALNGSDEEKSAAAKILCGASLKSGWNIQEHVVRFVVKLLCPPVPPNYRGSRSHLVGYTSMLSAILYRSSSIDTVHILSLHGMAPEVAACLVPLCEVFGSLEPTSHETASKGDESSIHMVFSLAFLFLLRLWRFYRPHLERCLTEHARAVGNELNLDYLLLMHNRRNGFVKDETKSNPDQDESVFDKAICIDSYPKLQAWYFQNISCVSSTLCSLSTDSPVHQVANKILNSINLKMTKSVSALDNFSISSNSGSPTSNGEDLYQRPMIPAWQILEAIPYVLQELLTACAHGRLSSRNLTTGLRDLIDFLPASLATIISYFSAEVTRGVWKSVPMNGIDWPSPAPLLRSLESEIKEILAAVGVSMPSCFPSFTSEGSEITLPLPMAALVSLTITFKLDKSLEYINAVAGIALENCASGFPWPGMPIIGSLWAQKVRRWRDFIVVSCSRSVFRQDKEAVDQLLRSCFSSFLGPLDVGAPSLNGLRSINGLLGFRISACTAPPCVAPGFLYLRCCRTIENVLFVNDMIVKLVAEYAQAVRWSSSGPARLKSSQASISLDAAKLRDVATLGASLLCITGGHRIVQELYMETIPTWLLSHRETKQWEVTSVSRVVEGYTIAYLAIISGAIMWGMKSKPPKWLLNKRVRIFGFHMDFLARVLEGKLLLGCHPATWKAYISCLVSLVLKFNPTWISDVKIKTLRTLASELIGWNEPELALSLLEKGGVEVMGTAGELVNRMR